jgi:hypothetical protein
MSKVAREELSKEMPAGVIESTQGNGHEKGNGQVPANLASTAQSVMDLSRFRLSSDYAATIGVKKLLTTVPVRKPDRQWFIRVHPTWKFETAVVESKEDNELYVVDQCLHDALAEELVPKVLFPAINRQGVVFLWPVRLPGTDGRLDQWNQSALEAAQIATGHWVRVAADRSLGAYSIRQPIKDFSDPEWPDVDFNEVLRIAFKERVIASPDHPFVRKLRGEV